MKNDPTNLEIFSKKFKTYKKNFKKKKNIFLSFYLFSRINSLFLELKMN